MSITLLKQAELDRLRVVLVASRNPLNIGAAARAMSNFGFRHLRVVNPYAPAFREARSAVGASELLAKAEEFDEVAQSVRHRILQQRLHGLERGGSLIRKGLALRRVALLFGSERVGLSNHDLSHCHWLMRIPTCEENISMNLGQAVAVCLYELVRNAKSATGAVAKDTPATGAEVERITELLNSALRESGYPGPEASNQLKVRRLIRRMRLSEMDAEVWQGIVRQLLWKIRLAGKPVP